MDISQLSDEELNKLSGQPDITKLSDKELISSQQSQVADVMSQQSSGKSVKPAQLEVPGFVKSAEMIGSGYMKGSLEFTGRFLSMAERAMRLGGEPTVVPDAYKYWDDIGKENAKKYKYAGVLQSVGEIPAEILTTAPLAGALGATSKAAEAVAAAVPYGAKTLAKYGTSGTLGAGVLSGMEGVRFDPKNPDQPFSVEQATAAGKDPVSYLAPMAGTLLSSYIGRSRDLREAKEIIPGIRNRDVPPGGVSDIVDSGEAYKYVPTAGMNAKSVMWDSIPNMLKFGKLPTLEKNVGDDISKYINTLAGGLDNAKFSKNYKEVAGKEFNTMLNNMKQGQADMWNKPFKSSPLENPQYMHDTVSNVQDILNSSGIPTAKRTSDLLNKELGGSTAILDASGNAIPGKGFTVENAKNVASLIGDAAGDAFSLGNATGTKMGAELSQLRKDLLGNMKSNLSGEDLRDFNAAQGFSRGYFDLLEQSSNVKAALYDTVDARNLIKSITSEAETLNKQNVMGAMTQEGKAATWATKIADALETSGYGKRAVNLKSFIKATAPDTNLPEVAGSQVYKAIEGLNVYLKGINAASQHKMSGAVGAMGALAAAGAVGTMGVKGALGVGAAAASYAALSAIASGSPVKSMLGHIGKKLSPSAHKMMSDKIGDYFARGGYFFTEDGILDKHDEQGK